MLFWLLLNLIYPSCQNPHKITIKFCGCYVTSWKSWRLMTVPAFNCATHSEAIFTIWLWCKVRNCGLIKVLSRHVSVLVIAVKEKNCSIMNESWMHNGLMGTPERIKRFWYYLNWRVLVQHGQQNLNWNLFLLISFKNTTPQINKKTNHKYKSDSWK